MPVGIAQLRGTLQSPACAPAQCRDSLLMGARVRLTREDTVMGKPSVHVARDSRVGGRGQQSQGSITGGKARSRAFPGIYLCTTAPFHFVARSSMPGYEYASTNVCSGGCDPSVSDRASISTARSIVSEVTTLAQKGL